MNFKTTILQTGNNTGIEVPAAVVAELGGGNKHLVIVTLNNYSYPSAIAKRSGRFMISLSAENRKKTGLKGGDIAEVTLSLDTVPRVVVVPPDLQQELGKSESVLANFEKLAPGKKKDLVFSVTEAKTEETRQKRIHKVTVGLQ